MQNYQRTQFDLSWTCRFSCGNAVVARNLLKAPVRFVTLFPKAVFPGKKNEKIGDTKPAPDKVEIEKVSICWKPVPITRVDFSNIRKSRPIIANSVQISNNSTRIIGTDFQQIDTSSISTLSGADWVSPIFSFFPGFRVIQGLVITPMHYEVGIAYSPSKLLTVSIDTRY